MTPSTPADSSRTAITAPDAPAAVGPYSHGVANGGLLYCSGALPLTPDGSRMTDESVAAETTNAWRTSRRSVARPGPSWPRRCG